MAFGKVKKTNRWMIAGGVLILAALLVATLRPKAVPVDFYLLQKGVFEDFIREDGITKAKVHATVTALVGGVIDTVKLKPGDAVKKGQTVATIHWDYEMPVRAPITGYVSKVHRESAGAIERGQPILDVVDPSTLEIQADLLTSDAVQVKEGTAVRIEQWGGSSSLKGHVRRIEPAAFTKISALGVEEQRVNAIIDIDSPREEWKTLGDSFRVECRIITFIREHAVSVPNAALFKNGEDWSVFKVVEGVAQKQAIQISRKNPFVSLVEAGLSAGDIVILYPPPTLQTGTRVQSRKSE